MSAAAEALAPTQTEFGSSRVAELQRCPTAHHLKYSERIFPRREAAYFDAGRIVHAGQRYVNEGIIAGEVRNWEDVIKAAYAEREAKIAAGTAVAPAWDEEDPILTAQDCLTKYYGTYGIENGGWPEGVKLLHVELFLEDRELQATCRADLVVDYAGDIVIPDTKTRAKVLPKDRNDYARGLRTNEQFLRLSALAQRHFNTPEPPAVWLDAVIKTARAPKDPDAKWPVDRLLVRFTQQDIDEWRRNAAALRDFQEGVSRHKLPLVRNYHECDPPIGQRCSYFNYCWGTETQRNEKFRKVTDG